MYKLFNNDFGNTSVIKYTQDNKVKWIPIDNANTDYQEYLEWVAEGNEPEAAD